MTFPVDSDRDCVRAWEAMPWVLQDSATHEQGEWLEGHLAQCEACRAEFAQQSRLRLAMSLPADISMDVNAGLGRLLSSLDAPESRAMRLRAGSRNWINRALVAVVLIQALGIGALGVKLWPTAANPTYRTLSQANVPAAPGAIHVVPDVSMSLADWNALLHALRLQVVNGPNDAGAYTVVPTNSTATTAHVLQQLRATRGIRLAEPVAATP